MSIAGAKKFSPAKELDERLLREEGSVAGRLLVVDGDEMNRDMLSQRLARSGYEVDVAGDGSEALSKIAATQFDLILLDIMMPGIGGLEVLKELRKTWSLVELPIVMATSKTDSEDVFEALNLGANDYVTKPLDFPVVLARLGAQLGLKKANEEIRHLASELEARNKFIQEVFGRYLSDDIVTSLLETPEGLQLGGETREITILMCDIRGFSVLSARLEPEQVVTMVNNFLGEMTDVIIEHGGTIDEIIGDAILVLFGAPVPRKDHAEAGVACAINMQRAIGRVNALNNARGLPAVEMGVGINSGEVVVGNIGSKKRTKYGVVGANVNLAARIEGYTVGGQVLVSDGTRRKVGDKLQIKNELKVQPKGSREPIVLHDVAGLGGEYNLKLPEKPVVLHPLNQPAAASVTLIAGKDCKGGASACRVLRLSQGYAEIQADAVAFEVLCNVRLEIFGDDGGHASGEIFAKVISAERDKAVLRFTSLPGEGKQFVKELLAHEASN